jgi:predicted Zn-dependent protease
VNVTGRYFDGQTSAATEATLEFGGDALTIRGLPQDLVVPIARIDISDRIANVARRVYLPGGATFETPDNDAMDRARDAAGLRPRSAFVHWLESRWPIAIAALASVVLMAFAFLRWGIPAVADWTARVLPPEVDGAIGSGTLDLLDRYVFLASDLTIERQRELEARFARMTGALHDGHEYRLEMRDGRRLGANAFALPSGIVVVTDQLVAMSKNDDEIVAVLAHEIGHVRGRHALRQMLQAAGVSVMSVTLLGDVNSITGVLNATPVLLNASNSREFEAEADGFARQWMRTHGVAESSFDAILCRLGDDHTEGEHDFFASHPRTSERARCPDGS